VLAAGLRALRAAGADTPFAGVDSVDDLPFGCADELVGAAIVAEEQASAKLRALAAHRTQISVAGSFFALSNNLGQQSTGTEYFRLALGSPGGERDAEGRETDLFGGIEEEPLVSRSGLLGRSSLVGRSGSGAG
jgi:N-acetyl-1-D-myo-inositol-2-amino-2-deoxy-alpha-D-glucopyranoside deacetylase